MPGAWGYRAPYVYPKARVKNFHPNLGTPFFLEIVRNALSKMPKAFVARKSVGLMFIIFNESA
jgi:hypothetical protein